MNDEEKELIKEFEITLDQKITYSYKGYKYDNLKDAVNFAKINRNGDIK